MKSKRSARASSWVRETLPAVPSVRSSAMTRSFSRLFIASLGPNDSASILRDASMVMDELIWRTWSVRMPEKTRKRAPSPLVLHGKYSATTCGCARRRSSPPRPRSAQLIAVNPLSSSTPVHFHHVLTVLGLIQLLVHCLSELAIAVLWLGRRAWSWRTVTNLSHFDPIHSCERIAPSKRGVKQTLGRLIVDMCLIAQAWCYEISVSLNLITVRG